MRRKKQPNVEIVPASEAALVPKAPAAKLQDMLDRMVRERVDEILAERGAGLMEPEFREKEVSIRIREQQTAFDRRRWSLYFEKWGCRGMCGREKVSHGGNGYCGACHRLVHDRLAQIKREWDETHSDKEVDRQINRISSRVRSAQAVLGEGVK